MNRDEHLKHTDRIMSESRKTGLTPFQLLNTPFYTDKFKTAMTNEEIDAASIANESKYQRIRELEEALRDLLEVGENDYADSEETIASMYERPFSRAKQLLNQKQ